MAAILNPGGGSLVFKPSSGTTAKGATAKFQKAPTFNFASPGPQYKPPPRIPAGTPPRAPGPDPYAALSTAELDSRSTDLANAGLVPQQQEIARQQALATSQATADEGAITGFSDAAAGYLHGIPGQVGAGYQAAAGTVGAIGTGVGGTIGADLAAQQEAGQQGEAAQGQQGGSSFAGGNVGDTVGYLGGVIPGAEIAQQGAAAQAEAARAVQIPLDAGAEQLTARMAQARSTNDQYAQQLIQLAATFPGLKAQALQQLNQYEVDKANYRESVHQNAVTNKANDRTFVEGQHEFKVTSAQHTADALEAKHVDAANIAHTIKADELAGRAEAAQEKAAGITATETGKELKFKWASLRFEKKQAIAKVKASGKIIDVSASKLRGHIVYKDGSQDTSIKVQQTAAVTPQQKALVNRSKATSKARVDGYNYATKLLGKPTAVPKTNVALPGQKVGKYVASPSASGAGVFPPAKSQTTGDTLPGSVATTNNPSLAERSGGGASDYADAQTKVWAEIDGDGLMQRYHYSRQQVLAIVNAALGRAGWHKESAAKKRATAAAAAPQGNLWGP